MKNIFKKYKNILLQKRQKNIKLRLRLRLKTFPVYDKRYTKTKIRTYGDNFYTNFRGLNVPEDGVECGSFTVISIDSLLVCEKKYYLQVYLDNCVY